MIQLVRGAGPWFAAALSALALTFLPLAAAAQTAPASMLGTWTAAPGGTVSTVVVAGSPGAYTIQVAAPCTPTPCNWGRRPLTIYAPNVSSTAGYLGAATYNQGFARRIVIVTTQNATAPFLRVQVLTQFTGGGRSNYATTQTLH